MKSIQFMNLKSKPKTTTYFIMTLSIELLVTKEYTMINGFFSIFSTLIGCFFTVSVKWRFSRRIAANILYRVRKQDKRGLQERKYREVGSMRSIWRVGEHARMAALGQKSHVE